MSVGLEPWTEADLPLVQALIGDPVMMEHLGGPEAPEKIVERHGRYVGAPGVFNVTFEGVRPAGSATGVFGPSNDWYYDLSARSRGE